MYKTLSIVLLSHNHFDTIIRHLVNNGIHLYSVNETKSSDNCPTAILCMTVHSQIKSIDICNFLSVYLSKNRINYYSIVCQSEYDYAFVPSNINLAYLSKKTNRKIGFQLNMDKSNLRLIEGSKTDPLEAS